MKENIKEEAIEVQKEVSDDTFAGFNEEQLWAIYVALERVQRTFVKPLAMANKSLAGQFRTYGEKKYWWAK